MFIYIIILRYTNIYAEWSKNSYFIFVNFHCVVFFIRVIIFSRCFSLSSILSIIIDFHIYRILCKIPPDMYLSCLAISPYSPNRLKHDEETNVYLLFLRKITYCYCWIIVQSHYTWIKTHLCLICIILLLADCQQWVYKNSMVCCGQINTRTAFIVHG